MSARPDTEDTTSIQIILKNNNGDTEDIYVAKDDEWVSSINQEPIKEIEVNQPGGFTIKWVRANIGKIFKAIEDNGEDLEESADITDWDDLVIEDYGLEPYEIGIDDEESVKMSSNESFEITIGQSSDALGKCRGVSLSLYNIQISGANFSFLPGIKNNGRPLYYNFVWC